MLNGYRPTMAKIFNNIKHYGSFCRDNCTNPASSLLALISMAPCAGYDTLTSTQNFATY